MTTAGSQELRAVWMALEGEDPELLAMPRAYSPRPRSHGPEPRAARRGALGQAL
jgi:hypothetical protein